MSNTDPKSDLLELIYSFYFCGMCLAVNFLHNLILTILDSDSVHQYRISRNIHISMDNDFFVYFLPSPTRRTRRSVLFKKQELFTLRKHMGTPRICFLVVPCCSYFQLSLLCCVFCLFVFALRLVPNVASVSGVSIVNLSQQLGYNIPKLLSSIKKNPPTIGIDIAVHCLLALYIRSGKSTTLNKTIIYTEPPLNIIDF